MKITLDKIGLFLNGLTLMASLFTFHGRMKFAKALEAFKSTGITDSATGTVVTVSDARVDMVKPVVTERCTTAGRPSAATAGQGAQIYDTDLGKPLWSNGAAWRDAMGADPDV